MDLIRSEGGQLAAFIVVGLAVLIVAVACDAFSPAKRRARRQRRDAYLIARRNREEDR